MNKRFLGLLVAVLAIVGGLYAVNDLFFTPKQTGPGINEKGAAGFAASFISSYFTYSNETRFEPIAQFTNLTDIRRASENLIEQEVISAETIDVQQLQSNFIKADNELDAENLDKGSEIERKLSKGQPKMEMEVIACVAGRTKKIMKERAEEVKTFYGSRMFDFIWFLLKLFIALRSFCPGPREMNTGPSLAIRALYRAEVFTVQVDWVQSQAPGWAAPGTVKQSWPILAGPCGIISQEQLSS